MHDFSNKLHSGYKAFLKKKMMWREVYYFPQNMVVQMPNGINIINNEEY